MANAVTLEGTGLHGGQPARATARRTTGPFRLVQGGWEATRAELSVAGTRRATTVEARGGKIRLATVEHAFAALAGLGLHEGVTLEVDGPELPLLDGCAAAWCAAFASLGAVASPPPLAVSRHAVFAVERSRYEFAPADDEVRVEVRIELDDPRVATRAAWDGSAADFVARVAPARTFALAADVAELAGAGLARHVEPQSVVLITPEAVHWAGRPFEPDEPARHKLLDLIGDLFVAGGPPRGRVLAVRPGHANNARAIRAAIDEGVLVPR